MEQQRRTVLKPPVRLADHVTAGAGPDLDTILTRVREGVERLTQEFVAVARATLTDLDANLAEARTSNGEDRRRALQRIFRDSHDLRGLGGTFDYPLITHIGSSLCDLIVRLDTATALHLEAVELHISAMKLVVAEGMTGDGGQRGQQLTASIQAMVGKVLAQS